jgi:N-acetylneuraminic acid mutarotase
MFTHRSATKVNTNISSTTKTHLVRGACYLLLLIGVCAIPFALAERNTTQPGKPSLRPVVVGTPAATDSLQKYKLSVPAGSPTPTPSGSCSPTTWQPGPDQPPARYAFQAALGTDNMLYVAGGQTAETVPTLYDQVSRYNYTTNTWSNVAPLPVPLGQGSIGAWNGKIYVAGGFIGGTNVTNALRIYDIATNTWTSGANMPTNPGVEAAAGAVVNGKFYVMGGDDFTNGLNTNFIYDIATNTWSTGAPLPDSRTNTSGTAYGGLIYVYGGVILPAFTTTDTLLRYDPVANSWTNLGSAGTAGLGNYGGISPWGTGLLLIADGADSMGNSTTSTRIFQICCNGFSPGPPMIGNRAGHAQGTLPDGRVLVADGFNTASTVVSTVELLTIPPCSSPTATPTATASPTPVLSPTATHTPPTPTVTATATHTPTSTPTATVTGTPTPGPRVTPTPRTRPSPVPRP